MESFRLSPATEDEVEAQRLRLMPLAGGGAVVEEDVPARDALERDARPVDDRRFRLVLYALDHEDAGTLASELATLGLSHERQDLGEVDWSEAWKDRHPPVELGRRIIVAPPWVDQDFPPERIVVRIEPGMAFGLGDAPSTRYCHELVEEALTPGMSVADIGTGSGLLAIAARLLGAGPIIACDVEPPAVEAAAENAARNGIAVGTGEGETAFIVREGSIEMVEGRFDLIVANIVWEVIEPMLPALVMRLRPGGSLIVGGIRPKHLDDVHRRVRALGLEESARRADDEIMALRFV